MGANESLCAPDCGDRDDHDSQYQVKCAQANGSQVVCPSVVAHTGSRHGLWRGGRARPGVALRVKGPDGEGSCGGGFVQWWAGGYAPAYIL